MNFDTITAKYQPIVLSLLRFVTGLLFLQYGLAKLLKWPPVPMFEKVELFSLYGAAGSLELVGGILLVLGLFTRPVAFIVAGEMAFAYFMGHAPRGFFPILNNGGLAIMFCFTFLYLAFAGGGPISLDAMLRKKS
jgi:putative oxidoreductase